MRTGVMLKTRIIPCLDVKDGRVVKGVRFVDLVDAGDPVEAAKAYDAAGADEMCFLDITASHEGRGILLDVVARTAEFCFMPLTVGGGVRKLEDIRALLLAGADKVSINTAAVKNRGFVKEAAQKFGDQCITVAIDAKRVNSDDAAPRWEIFTHGGRERTGIDAVAFAQEVVSLGAGEILVTSMDRDGSKIRLRYRADARHRGPRARAGRRFGRSRHPRASGRRRKRRPCERGARGLHFPFRRIHHSRGEAASSRGGDRGEDGSMTTRFTLADLERTIAERSSASPE